MKKSAQVGSAHWVLSPDIPEIPTYWVRDEMWTTEVARPWRNPGDMSVLEGRALLGAVERFCHSSHGAESRSLLLVDDLGSCLRFAWMRSSKSVFLFFVGYTVNSTVPMKEPAASVSRSHHFSHTLIFTYLSTTHKPLCCRRR